MPLSRGLRKLSLTAHIASSVGWLGSVTVFLALGVIGVISDDPQTVRAVFTVMEPAGWTVLVPLAALSLVTGIIVSLGSNWGLFRHYWVVFKLVINLTGLAVLLLYMQTLTGMAAAVATPTFAVDELGAERGSPLLHAALAEVLLLAATVLSVYKPRGLTRYGQRKKRQAAVPATSREKVA